MNKLEASRKLSHQGASLMELIDEGDVDISTGMYDFQGQFEYQNLLPKCKR